MHRVAVLKTVQKQQSSKGFICTYRHHTIVYTVESVLELFSEVPAKILPLQEQMYPGHVGRILSRKGLVSIGIKLPAFTPRPARAEEETLLTLSPITGNKTGVLK